MIRFSGFARAEVLWGVLAVAVVMTTVEFARREIWPAGHIAPPPGPRTLQDGVRLANAGILVGDSSAPVRIVEFADFECRHCQRFQRTLAEFRGLHPGSVAIVFRHFPISRLGFSVPAAIAAECAAAQGHFPSFADSLFASQDTLSRMSMETTALLTGVSDTARFHACRLGSEARARVQQDVEAGTAVGVIATPTVIVGNQLVVGEMPLAALEDLVRVARKRQSER